MVRQKEFVILTWNKMTLIDKPPFFMWAGAAVSSLIGLSEFSIRLPSAVSALVLIIWVTYFCYKNHGFIPSLLAFSSLAFNNIFIWRARTGNIDALVSLEIFLSYFLLLSKSRYKYFLLGILFAIVYLTKASLVFFPLGIFFLYELFFERKNLKKNIKNYLLLILIFISLSGIWLVLGSLKEGWRFAQYYLFRSDQGAANFDLSAFNPNYLRYAYYSLQRRFFWVLLLGLVFLIPRMREAKYFLLFLFSTLLTVLISFGKKDNNWYLLPSMPFWSMSISYGTYRFIELFKKRREIKALVTLVVVVLSFYVSYKTYTVNIRSVISSQTTANQAKVSSYLNRVSKEEDKVARLDHLYPTTIYYSGRFVYCSDQSAGTGGFFLSRNDLLEKIRMGEIGWVIGKKTEVDRFSQNLTPGKWRVVFIEGDEALLQIE